MARPGLLMPRLRLPGVLGRNRCQLIVFVLYSLSCLQIFLQSLVEIGLKCFDLLRLHIRNFIFIPLSSICFFVLYNGF
jgi:hypothetical protein